MSTGAISNLAIARFFTADKFIKNPLLNAMGAQVARIVAAQAIYRLRRGKPVDTELDEYLGKLQREGYVAIPDFLPPAEFAALRDESLAALRSPDTPKADLFHGQTRVRRILLKGAMTTALPTASRVTADSRIAALLSAIEKRPVLASRCHRAIEEVTHGPLSVPDPENSLHSDTFHNTHKAWLYLSDVGEREGPLAFVPGSHRIDGPLLGANHRYYAGIHRSKLPASRRIEAAEVEQRKLREISFAVPANTLVIANTFGYHRRLRGAEGAQRFALHVSVRTQPFLYWHDAAAGSDY